jgi:hypothetical protein
MLHTITAIITVTDKCQISLHAAFLTMNCNFRFDVTASKMAEQAEHILCEIIDPKWQNEQCISSVK